MQALQNKLKALRQIRNFEAQSFLAKKQLLLWQFFANNGLDAAVVGLSGGVDSALVAALCADLAKQPNSPLRKLRAIIAPIYGQGTSGQDEAKARALEQAQTLQQTCPHFEYRVCDLSPAYEALLATAPQASAWAQGQMASVLRTPLFYYQAALLQEQGHRSLVLGTTNRDEGAYIGFFGKASDGMVDLQPIADLHKSEVYALAELLGVVPSILQAIPRGDVWDNQVDEDMIGAPYWFLELYQLLRCSGELTSFRQSLDETSAQYFDQKAENIERLHRQNAHKYEVGSPAHYLDVLERKVP
jgi:NAD+ synthase (glutamine-hydrolysing)